MHLSASDGRELVRGMGLRTLRTDGFLGFARSRVRRSRACRLRATRGSAPGPLRTGGDLAYECHASLEGDLACGLAYDPSPGLHTAQFLTIAYLASYGVVRLLAFACVLARALRKFDGAD